jgi:hypothetical protein
VCLKSIHNSPWGESAEPPLDRKTGPRVEQNFPNLIRARSRNATVVWRVCAPRTIMISDDHLGCLILVGIKSRYILAGTLSFQASSSSLHTCIKYYFVCTQRGLLLSAPSAVAFDGITLLVTPSLAMSSPLLFSQLSCFFYEWPCFLRLSSLGRARGEGGVVFLLISHSPAHSNCRIMCDLDACSDRNAESASTNSNSMPVQRARLIYDVEMPLSSEPETSCFKAS